MNDEELIIELKKCLNEDELKRITQTEEEMEKDSKEDLYSSHEEVQGFIVSILCHIVFRKLEIIPDDEEREENLSMFYIIKQRMETMQRNQSSMDVFADNPSLKLMLKFFSNQDPNIEISFTDNRILDYYVHIQNYGHKQIFWLKNGKTPLTRIDKMDPPLNLCENELNDEKCNCPVIFHDISKSEFYCPKCGLVTQSQGLAMIEPFETWSNENKQTPKTRELSKKIAKYDKKGRHAHNKHYQSITLDSTLKEGLNLTEYQRREIKRLINKLNYAKLYGNKSKTVNVEIKTAAVCVYYLEEIEGINIRVGRSRKYRFLKELGLTNDIYKVILNKIRFQLLDQ